MFTENPTKMAKAPDGALSRFDATSVAIETDAACTSIRAVAVTLTKIAFCPNQAMMAHEINEKAPTRPAKVSAVLISKALEMLDDDILWPREKYAEPVA